MSMRLPRKKGELINRNKEVQFSFEGQTYKGFEGDTITSALLGLGVKVLGRSFKYHRARGVLSFANHDVNVLLTDGEDTNIRADVVKLKYGMDLSVVNTQGGVIKDKRQYIDSLSPLLPVGFYYKAFHKPASLFPFWEKIIRKAAGLGEVNFSYPRITKRKLNDYCEVLVIGAGVSGLSAAIAAAEKGLEVILVDENPVLGGSLTYDHAGEDGSLKLLAELSAKVSATSNIKTYLGAYVAGYYADHMLPVVTLDGIVKVRAKTVIAATGVFEQPPVFHNNDLPGVMLGSAAQRLINRYAVKPFNEGVVLTANDYGYRVAMDLLENGVVVKAVVDMRAQSGAHEILEKLKRFGVKLYMGYSIYEAIPVKNKLGVASVRICPFNDRTAETDLSAAIKLECDGVVMSAGWAPAAALLYQSGMSVRYDNLIEQFVPKRLPKGVYAAGRVNGVYGLQARIQDGQRAANEAASFLGKPTNNISVDSHQGTPPSHPYPFVHHPKGKNFVDFDEDIQIKDFINAAKEGFDNIELMKRFTTVGMGPSQGKHSNMNAIRLLARIRQLPIEKIGSTTARPFFHPTPMGHLGGRSFHPHRLTSIHAWHQEASAEFVDVGAWSRPAYYQKSGLSKLEAVQQEAAVVRNGVGMIDGGTLGKIEVCGPDAGLFLERFYTGRYVDQKVGKSRYVLLLDELGVVVDDGIATRLTDEKFFVTVSTSNAAAVYREMQRWMQIWKLDVVLVNVTGAYGVINVAGPLATKVLSKLVTLDFSEAAFSIGLVKQTFINKVPVNIVRSGFVSKQSYEITVPVAHALNVWQLLLEVGEPEGLRPFGTETQRLLRLELGHPLPGHDTDGLTNPFELGVEAAIAMDKPFFIGKRSLAIIAKKPLSKKLVCFVLPKDYKGQMPQDCNLVIESGEIAGRVTSISFSPTLQRIIGMAYVFPHQAVVGHLFEIRTDDGRHVEATVVNAPFFEEHKG